MPESIRLRFAPSPTGMLHIGGARTALFAWAYARRHGGVFVLRIEDTDRERSGAGYEQAILDGLRWLGIDWDEGPDVGGPYGPYRQTERLEHYRRAAERLLAAGAAYRCFCSAARLEELRARQTSAGDTAAYDGLCRAVDPAEARARSAGGEPFVVRFRVPPGETRFSDLIRGHVAFRNEDVDDWIMVRSDGAPTYNFAVVCDDSEMRITHVLRGEEHLTNTPKQVLLYQALGLEVPVFAHLPLMLGTDGKKLSKRTGDTALLDYRDQGYPPEAVLNFLCLQGWALDDRTDLFSVADLVRHFDPADVGKRGAIFDPEKFLWMAGEYIRSDELARVASRCAPFVVRAGLMSEGEIAARRPWFESAVALAQERIRLYSELPARIAYLFAPDDEVPWQPAALKNARRHEGAEILLGEYLAWLRPQLATGGGAPVLRETTRGWLEARGTKPPVLLQPLRCVLTGEPGGADIFDVIAVLGSERTISRLEAGIRRLASSAPAE
ncbi:MAG: glutamate--tRNA ligase [Planctomycetota bacterium]